MQTLNTYSFNELSDEAKQVAFNNSLYINVDHWDWYDSTKDDFHTILELIGFYNIDSSFSGFYSQGDGASFSADYRYKKGCLGASFSADYRYKKGCLKAVKQHVPNDTELHDIVKCIVSHQKNNGYLLSSEMSQLGYYCHSNTKYFPWCKNDDSYFYWKNDLVECELEQLFKDLANWYYSRLVSEYEYLTSFDVVAEMLEDNEIKFLENGEGV